MAVTFCGYGIVRKRVDADAQTGLFVECLILSAPGLAYLIWLQSSGGAVGTASPTALAWLIACGPFTALPMMLFAWAARRVPLSTLAFLQFVAPSMTFVIGVSQGESLSPLRAASFGLIWLGALVFAAGAWRRARRAAALAQSLA